MKGRPIKNGDARRDLLPPVQRRASMKGRPTKSGDLLGYTGPVPSSEPR